MRIMTYPTTLTDEQVGICRELVERARKWGLFVKRKEDFIGFGRRREFYLFWISWGKEFPYFKARLTYAYEQPQELEPIELTAQNEAHIYAEAERIFDL